jgi:hypothetical protein
MLSPLEVGSDAVLSSMWLREKGSDDVVKNLFEAVPITVIRPSSEISLLDGIQGAAPSV